MRGRIARALSWIALASCTPSPPISAGDASTPTHCAADVDCDDGLYCTGIEHCALTDAGADARGCVAGMRPCGSVCDETTDTCPACGESGDLDGDGARTPACGGNDCDDDDPRRHPLAIEVCDAADVDEDCDPTTVGTRDADGDGAIDIACCNGMGDARHCGDDCDDTSASVNRMSTEACDLLDNDCDMEIDEGVPPGVYYRDLDGDGAGDPFMHVEACQPPHGFVLTGNDCDDTNAMRAPTRTEICNGVDDDCNLLIDDALPGTGSDCTVASGTGACASGTTVCDSTGTGLRCVPRDSSTPETCNGIDDDCDTRVDEMVPGVGSPCAAPGALGACAAGTLRCFGASGSMCLPGTPSVEACSAADEDCDGDPINRGRPGGFECLTGDTRACSACGLTGTERCVGCAWTGACEAGGVGSTQSWAAADPRYTGGASASYCSLSDSSARCCFTADEPYCLQGGGVALVPASYELRIFGPNQDSTDPLTIEIVDVTAASTPVTRIVSHPGCGAWSERIPFTTPAGACHTFEFRVHRMTNGGFCGYPGVSGIELTRTSNVLLY